MAAKMINVFLLCVAAVTLARADEFSSPEAVGPAHFAENFQDPASFATRWVKSEATKDGADADIAKYNGEWNVEAAAEGSQAGDVGLVLKDKAKHAAISVSLDEVFTFADQPLIFQYEVKLQEGMECGGSYVKLLSKTDDLNLAQFTDQSPYTIMFGPDTCGVDNKLHFIFRHKHPKTGKFEEKHADMAAATIPSTKDKQTHLLRLVVRPDNSFTISVDRTIVKSGSLLEDMKPSVNPPTEIDDPEDKRPENWDDQEKIPDPQASKPDDWDEDAPSHIADEDATMPSDWLLDEAEYVADPDADKPDDWDTQEDGEYEAPQISNPKCAKASGCGPWTRPTKVNPAYKGKWRAPMIDNPQYQGVWAPSKIPNPDFFEDNQPFAMSPIGAIGLELWTMTANQMFDNILLTSDEAVADRYAADGFDAKKSSEAPPSAAHNLLTQLLSSTEERPWLWAVYVIVVVVLPVVLVVACCLPGKKDPAAELRAQAKKTDEPQPDDPQPPVAEAQSEVEEVEEEEVGEAAASDPEVEESEVSPAATPEPAEQAPAEVKEEEEEEAVPVASASADAEPKAASSPEPEALDVPEGEAADGESPRRSPRKGKKKVRREN